ncbi:MAG TPA: response regulator [Candidatus Bathyarchaeota archaeon]|nr:response regulator [Candidatus Bathyarchaeota archaeon]
MARILVVDDEEDVLELTRLMLESEGYTVETARSGEEALGKVYDWRPDLVLLDAVMPGTHGLDVCRRLKRDKDTRRIPVIIFTALGTGVDLMLGEGDKADGYLQKPFTKRQLMDLIQRLIG